MWKNRGRKTARDGLGSTKRMFPGSTAAAAGAAGESLVAVWGLSPHSSDVTNEFAELRDVFCDYQEAVVDGDGALPQVHRAAFSPNTHVAYLRSDSTLQARARHVATLRQSNPSATMEDAAQSQLSNEIATLAAMFCACSAVIVMHPPGPLSTQFVTLLQGALQVKVALLDAAEDSQSPLASIKGNVMLPPMVHICDGPAGSAASGAQLERVMAKCHVSADSRDGRERHLVSLYSSDVGVYTLSQAKAARKDVLDAVRSFAKKAGRKDGVLDMAWRNLVDIRDFALQTPAGRAAVHTAVAVLVPMPRFREQRARQHLKDATNHFKRMLRRGATTTAGQGNVGPAVGDQSATEALAVAVNILHRTATVDSVVMADLERQLRAVCAEIEAQHHAASARHVDADNVGATNPVAEAGDTEALSGAVGEDPQSEGESAASYSSDDGMRRGRRQAVGSGSEEDDYPGSLGEPGAAGSGSGFVMQATFCNCGASIIKLPQKTFLPKQSLTTWQRACCAEYGYYQLLFNNSAFIESKSHCAKSLVLPLVLHERPSTASLTHEARLQQVFRGHCRFAAHAVALQLKHGFEERRVTAHVAFQYIVVQGPNHGGAVFHTGAYDFAKTRLPLVQQDEHGVRVLSRVYCLLPPQEESRLRYAAALRPVMVVTASKDGDGKAHHGGRGRGGDRGDRGDAVPTPPPAAHEEFALPFAVSVPMEVAAVLHLPPSFFAEDTMGTNLHDTLSQGFLAPSWFSLLPA